MTSSKFGLDLAVRFDIEQLHYYASHFSKEENDGFLRNIIERHSGVTREVIETYRERLISVWQCEPDESVTIFAREHDRLAGRPCFDSRHGNQMLPRGVWAVGFISGGRALLNHPFLYGEQSDNLYEAVVGALLTAGEMDAEEKAPILIATGFVSVARYEGVRREEVGL